MGAKNAPIRIAPAPLPVVHVKPRQTLQLHTPDDPDVKFVFLNQQDDRLFEFLCTELAAFGPGGFRVDLTDDRGRKHPLIDANVEFFNPDEPVAP